MSSAEPKSEYEDTNGSAGTLDPAKLLNAVADEVVAEARRHPLRTLGIAFAAGYVLGGGVPQFAVRMAASAALRSLGRAAITSGLAMELARGAFGGVRHQGSGNATRNGKGRARPKSRKASGGLPS